MVSLRLKLTLWTMIIFVVLQLSLGFVFLLYLSEAINRVFDDQVGQRARAIASAVRDRLPNITDTELAAIADEPYFLRENTVVAIFEQRQTEPPRVLAATKSLTDEWPSELLGQLAIVRNSENFRAMVGIPGVGLEQASVARGAAIGMSDPRGHRYVLAVFVNDDHAQRMLSLASQVLLLTIPIGIIATGIATYVISGIAVRPIYAVTRAARSLSPESIGERMNVPVVSSEMAALNKELELARQRIETGFRAQERFMSNISHEIKTPIAVILAEAQSLKTDGLPQQVREFIHSAAEEAGKLGRTVDSFLLLTRVRHGKAEIPQSETCLIRDVLLDSYQGCRPMAVMHGVRLELVLPDDDGIDGAVMGNCDLLRTIFDNLIRNGIRFSPRDSVVSIVAATDNDPVTGERRISISVRDRGPGIPAELLPRIFDRFSQSKEEERRGRGHGLGLEIAQGIAELHGGRITVSNVTENGGGAEFRVWLPLHLPQS